MYKFLCFFIVLCLIDLHVCERACSEDLVQNKKCIPIGLTCLSGLIDGSGLDWFDMQDHCVSNDGRLLWLTTNFTKEKLTSSSIHNVNKTTFIALGLLTHASEKGDNQSFWRNPLEGNSTYSCKKTIKNNCLPSTANKTDCQTVGCCWVNGSCLFPDKQNLTKYEGESILELGDISSNGRQCVGLRKNESNVWILVKYDCFNKTVLNSGFVCEYKCGDSWPNISPLNAGMTYVTHEIPFSTNRGNVSANKSTPTTLFPTSSKSNIWKSKAGTNSSNGSGNEKNSARNTFNYEAVVVTVIFLLSMDGHIE